MQTVGSYEAKTHLPRLLEDVARGETVVITRHGTPIARIVPAPETVRPSVEEAIRGLRTFRVGKRLGGISVRELVEQGRRF